MFSYLLVFLTCILGYFIAHFIERWRSIYVVDGNKEWFALGANYINSRVLILKNLGDIKPYYYGPKFTADTVYTVNNDKNFMCYWMNKKTLIGQNGKGPSKLYIDSHPCDSNMFINLDMTKFIIHLKVHYYREHVPVGIKYSIEDYSLPFLY